MNLPNGGGGYSEFERCWPWLQSAIDRLGPGTLGKEHLWKQITERKAFLFPGNSSAMVCNFIHHPTGLKSGNAWLAGGDLDEILERVPKLEAWGLRHGCYRALVFGRRGWGGVLDGYGYKENGVRFSRILK